MGFKRLSGFQRVLAIWDSEGKKKQRENILFSFWRVKTKFRILTENCNWLLFDKRFETFLFCFLGKIWDRKWRSFFIFPSGEKICNFVSYFWYLTFCIQFRVFLSKHSSFRGELIDILSIFLGEFPESFDLLSWVFVVKVGTFWVWFLRNVEKVEGKFEFGVVIWGKSC